MDTLRSKLHRSVGVDKWMDLPDVSKVMQEALDLSEELGVEISVSGKIAGRRGDISGPDRLAQQSAAIAALPVRLVSAVKTAQTSRGSKRLHDLKRVIKESKKLAGVTKSLDPSIGVEKEVLGMAIEDIANHAEKLEKAVSDPSSLVEQVNEGLEKTEKIDSDPTKLDRILESTANEIRAKERQCNPEAYAEVVGAEEPCLARSGLDILKLADLRYRVSAKLPGAIAQLMSVIYKLETGSRDIPVQIMVENQRLWYLETESRSATVSKRLSASGEIPSQKLKLMRLESELREFKASKDEKLATAKQRLSTYEQELERYGPRISEFDDCVKNSLQNASHADTPYLKGSFPEYTTSH